MITDQKEVPKVSIEDHIRDSLELLCIRLEKGYPSDVERTKFQGDLARGIEEAIESAIQRHESEEHD